LGTVTGAVFGSADSEELEAVLGPSENLHGVVPALVERRLGDSHE